jgi:hypothetical protein
VTKGPVVNLRLVMTTVRAPGHGLSTRRPSLYHGYRGPVDQDDQIRPSSAWALFQKFSLRRVQANNDPYRRYLCAL